MTLEELLDIPREERPVPRLRLAFTGASGTGKTTLARRFSEEFGLPLCPVGSREVAKAMGFASPYDVDAAGKRKEFQRRLFEEKVAWESAHEAFVTDRTVIDNVTYSDMPGGGLPAPAREVTKATSAYDIIFWTRMEDGIDIGDDPARMSDLAYHSRFEGLLRSHYRAYAAGVVGVRFFHAPPFGEDRFIKTVRRIDAVFRVYTRPLEFLDGP